MFRAITKKTANGPGADSKGTLTALWGKASAKKEPQEGDAGPAGQPAEPPAAQITPAAAPKAAGSGAAADEAAPPTTGGGDVAIGAAPEPSPEPAVAAQAPAQAPAQAAAQPEIQPKVGFGCVVCLPPAWRRPPAVSARGSWRQEAGGTHLLAARLSYKSTF